MSGASDTTKLPPALTERTLSVQDLPDNDLHSERMELSMGPQHPATHGVLQCKLVLDGEKIISLDPVVGWMSREEVRRLEDLPPETAAVPTNGNSTPTSVEAMIANAGN